MVRFAYKHKMPILADEVYQENVYAENKSFLSFRKVKEEMKDKHVDTELFSFHSISKGLSGECGFRGGYVHMADLDKGAFEELLRHKS